MVTQYSMNNLDLADIDGDGDMDLLTNEHKGPRLELQWWLNDGRGNFTKRVIGTGHENHLGTQLADLDNDGDLDIFGGAWDNYRFFHLWRNDRQRGDDPTGTNFREFMWSPRTGGLNEEFLRVGGKLDYRTTGVPGAIPLTGELPLREVSRATVIVERVQSHEDTKNLQIRFNDGPWLHLPEPSAIAGKATDYMFHANISVDVPLSSLRPSGNKFELRVDRDQSWDWPQNLIYGVMLRTYLNGDRSPTEYRIVAERTATEAYRLSLTGVTDDISRVDYIARYTGIDPSGLATARKYHYRMHGGQIDGHIGTATNPPYALTWNTEWLPDQDLPIQLTARVHTKRGIIQLLDPVDIVHDERTFSVYQARPASVPPFWVTRNDSFTQSFELPFDPKQGSAAAKLSWSAWSPCYNAGIAFNGREIPLDDPGPCYVAAWQELPVPASSLQAGTNTITTAQTPLQDGEMVHGMEVQYPGFYLTVRHPSAEPVKITTTRYEDRPHFLVRTPTATYYYDRAGGGLSRMIDCYGNDWIAYHNKPWDQYPASAASAYRGMPNLVFGGENGGAGHPGHDRMESTITGPREITSVTSDGRWRWVWTFGAESAHLQVTDVPPGARYWFLYEGTPGGRYDPENALFGAEVGSKPLQSPPDFYRGESLVRRPLRQFWFGDRDLPHALLVTHLTDEPRTGLLGYLGNTEKGVDSPDGMVVSGFGRNAATEPLLSGNQSFRIGFVPLDSVSINSK